jgi:hypothetical protein
MPQEETSSASDTVPGVVWFVAIVIILGIVSSAYSFVDGIGWISHTRETTITAEPNWLVGESKTCLSFPLDADEAKSWNSTKGDVTHRIGCDRGGEHLINVKFWGRLDRFEERSKFGVSWKCTKNNDSFTCYALD